MNSIIKILIAVLASFGAGLLGYLFVDSHVSSWYAGLTKPPFVPPDITFTIVWIILYALMALALAIVWTKEPPPPLKSGWIRFFFVQLLLNASYTLFFFGFHSIFLSCIIALFLGFVVLALTVSAGEIDSRAAYLMVPYLLWLVFATYLTLGVWLLN